MGKCNCPLQESNNQPCVPLNTLSARQDEETRQAHQMTCDAKQSTEAPCRKETDSSLSEAQSSESSSSGLPGSGERGQSDGAEDEGSPLKKLQRMVSNVTLALDNPVSEDGVLRRPHDSLDGRDPSPDRNNDSDSVSAYEDAVADTPEMDRIFPGVADTLDLSNDSSTANEDGSPANNCQHSDSEAPDTRNPDVCILS